MIINIKFNKYIVIISLHSINNNFNINLLIISLINILIYPVLLALCAINIHEIEFGIGLLNIISFLNKIYYFFNQLISIIFSYILGISINLNFFNNFIFNYDSLINAASASIFPTIKHYSKFPIAIKELKGLSGIYQIENNKNSKSYVGSSINMGKRLIEHINQAKNLVKVKGSSHFYNAINKYDLSNFTVKVLEFSPIDKLIDRENYFINIIKPEYNILKIAGRSPMLGRKHSIKTIEKISKSQKGNKFSLGIIRSRETRDLIRSNQNPISLINLPLAISIKVRNIKTNEIHIFPSITKAAQFLNCSKAALSYCLKNNSLFKKTYIISTD